MKTRHLVPMVLAALALAACDAAEPAAPADLLRTPVPVASALSPVPGVEEVVGESGPGSTYALLKPANWNGELVVYAHGYVQPHLEPSLVMEIGAIRDWLLSQGFAFAHAGGSETGYAVKDGVLWTHQLSGLFDEAFGEPTRTYLVGVSLGGLVVEHMAERFRSQYDGTLALCGVMAGGAWNAAYIAHFRVLFDYFYPGVLPGTLLAMPEGARIEPGSPLFFAVLGAISANPYPAIEMAAMDQIQLRYTSITELVTAFIQVLGYQVNGANALTDRVNGKSFFDNTTVRYSGSRDDDAVNAAVARYEGDPSAENYFDHWWNPAGRIGAPFVTLHTTRDPLVPERSEQIFAETVAAAGNAGLLLQRTTDAFGHCAFTGPDIIGAFLALRQWVATGSRPPA
ncbi:MAG TPA: hypothetical protein VMM12_01600 [Longimicrobiales bacterium]|nr:hypothetical protein [Longimicrobiales bacterium]